VEARPFKLNFIKPQENKPNPLLGVSEMTWSFDSLFVATKNDSIPNVIWIWQISNLSLYSLAVQSKPIRDFSWSPKEYILTIVTENNKVYVLSLTDASVCPILTDNNNYNLSLSKVTWANDGKSYIVGDRSYMFIGCPVINSEEQDQYQDQEQEEENEGNN